MHMFVELPCLCRGVSASYSGNFSGGRDAIPTFPRLFGTGSELRFIGVWGGVQSHPSLPARAEPQVTGRVPVSQQALTGAKGWTCINAVGRIQFLIP